MSRTVLCRVGGSIVEIKYFKTIRISIPPSNMTSPSPEARTVFLKFYYSPSYIWENKAMWLRNLT